MITSIPQEEFFYEKLLLPVLFVVLLWFIMGYNPYIKKDLGKINIDRYKCSNCGNKQEEGCSFWENLKTLLFGSFNNFFQILRYHSVSYDGVSDITDFNYPRSISTILRAFNEKWRRA